MCASGSRWRGVAPLAPCWRQPFHPSVSASVEPDQRVAQAADGAPIGRPLFKNSVWRSSCCVTRPRAARLQGVRSVAEGRVRQDDPDEASVHRRFLETAARWPATRRPTLSSSRPARRESRPRLLAPTMHCIRAFPESLHGRRKRNACSTARRPMWPGWRRPSSVLPTPGGDTSASREGILPAARCALTEELFGKT